MVLAIFIQQPTPFVTVFFERLLKLQYPKNRIKLFIDNRVDETSVSSVGVCRRGWVAQVFPIISFRVRHRKPTTSATSAPSCRITGAFTMRSSSSGRRRRWTEPSLATWACEFLNSPGVKLAS